MRVAVADLQIAFDDGETAAEADTKPGQPFRGADKACDRYGYSGSRRKAFVDGYSGFIPHGCVIVDTFGNFISFAEVLS